MKTFESRPFPFGVGVYSFWEAARYVGATTRQLRGWVRSYSPNTVRDDRRPALWDSQLVEWRRKDLGFTDLMELRFVRAMHAAGVSLPVIRRTLELGRDRLQVAYPLSCDSFREHGKQIFLEALAREDISHLRFDEDSRRNVLRNLVGPGFREGFELDALGQVKRWYPLPKNRAIVLDPDRRAGEPILTEAGVPTVAIAAAYKADKEDVPFVAWQYRISEDEVRTAVHFETEWRPA